MSKVSNFFKALRPERPNTVRVVLLCFVAATTFWFFNSLNANYDTNLEYPIEFLYDESTYVPLEPLPEKVQLNVSGLGWNLFRNSLGIKVTTFSIPLDNPAEIKKIPGTSLPGYLSDQLNDLQLNYVLTDTLYVNIDVRTTRKFKLYFDRTSIDLAENHFMTSPINYDPDSVELQGPNSILYSFADSLLVNVPQQEIDEDFNEDIPINLPQGRLISRNPPTVTVRFDVDAYENQSAEVSLSIENILDKAYIETEAVSVNYMVPSEDSPEFNPETDIKVVVDFSNFEQSDSSLVPQLSSFPDFLRKVQLDSTRIKVYFNE